MNENRRSQRINYLGTGWLEYKEAQYFCRVENISTRGAMVVLKKTPADSIQQGDKCCLKLYQDIAGQPYRIFASQIVRFESAVAGLEFIELEEVSKGVLESIIQRELSLFDGADTIIKLAWEIAGFRGIDLTDVHFDKGELIPDREIHTLRFFAGDHTANIHLQRADIEDCYIQKGTVHVRKKIHEAIDRLLW